MTATAINVERVSKRFFIGHQEQRAKYLSLREVVTEKVKMAAQAIAHLGNRVDGIRGTREEFWALRDVSFEVKQGDRLGIIGGNGAGKSTLLKILSRIVEPTEGRIQINGRMASLLEVGTGFHPELTGRENIFLNGAILGMANQEIRRKFDEIVAFAEVERFLDTPVKRYSSGMYVRLAFAVAAHLEPEILVVDEVLAVGDAQFQKKCLGKMEEVGRDGRTVLFVSHNMNAIEQLCDSCLLVHKGKIMRQGSDVRAIIKEYLFGEAEGQKRSEWLNAGDEFENEFFKPLRFSLVTANGTNQVNPVRNDEDIFIEVQGIVHKPHPALALQYTVYSDDGTLLFHSSTIDHADNVIRGLNSGPATFRTRIPRRFLNEGDYRIDLTVFLHNIQFITEYGINAPCFFLVIQGGLTDSPLWTNKRQGIVAPMIEWSCVPSHDVIVA